MKKFLNKDRIQYQGEIFVIKNKISELKRELNLKIQKLYPVGSIVELMRGNGLVEVVIMDHSDFLFSDPRIKVKNLKSQKIYWVYVFGHLA